MNQRYPSPSIAPLRGDTPVVNTADVIVIGAGVVGCSIAWNLAHLGAGRVVVFDRGRIGEGTSAQSSGILRTHYSVPENIDLAVRSLTVFRRFAQELDDEEAACGLVECGYLIAAPDGAKAQALDAALSAQLTRGIAVQRLSASQARELLPIARLDDAALIGYEPHAGYADAHLTTTAYARAARRRGVRIVESMAVHALQVVAGRVVGVQTPAGPWAAPVVVSAQNIWTPELVAAVGVEVPVVAERHRVLALACEASPYTRHMPVFKDLASRGLLYARSYGGNQMLVSEGLAGEVLDTPDVAPGDVPMDLVADIGEQVADRFPAWGDAGLASAWTGVYDVTPDWNPVLGAAPGVQGLYLATGFSGHGFKLSPAVGRVIAQAALGHQTDVSLAPYRLERFAAGELLRGRYGAGAVS